LLAEAAEAVLLAEAAVLVVFWLVQWTCSLACHTTLLLEQVALEVLHQPVMAQKAMTHLWWAQIFQSFVLLAEQGCKTRELQLRMADQGVEQEVQAHLLTVLECLDKEVTVEMLVVLLPALVAVELELLVVMLYQMLAALAVMVLLLQ